MSKDRSKRYFPVLEDRDCLVTTQGGNNRELPWELKSMVWEGLDPVTDPY